MWFKKKISAILDLKKKIFILKFKEDNFREKNAK